MISKRLVLFSCACITTGMMLWPAEATAQQRAVPRTTGRAHVVSGGYYRPYYYRPYYYRPYYYAPYYYSGFYSPFYSPFYFGVGFGGGWGGFYGQWAYPAYPGYYYGGSWASARLEVKPREAQVFVDGYYVGTVDQFDGVFQRLDLPTGEHEVSVYQPGYRTYTQRNLFRPGAGYHFKAILEPLPAGAPPEPAPKPSPDSNRGRDPEGYGDPRDPRDPREPQDPRDPRDPRDSGRTVPMPDRSADRRAPESRDFGTLNLRVQPGDAVVIIDGERWDSPEGGSRLMVQLAGGSHRIEVRKDGFKPYTSTVQIRPGETQSLNISLPPG